MEQTIWSKTEQPKCKDLWTRIPKKYVNLCQKGALGWSKMGKVLKKFWWRGRFKTVVLWLKERWHMQAVTKLYCFHQQWSMLMAMVQWEFRTCLTAPVGNNVNSSSSSNETSKFDICSFLIVVCFNYFPLLARFLMKHGCTLLSNFGKNQVGGLVLATYWYQIFFYVGCNFPWDEGKKWAGTGWRKWRGGCFLGGKQPVISWRKWGEVVFLGEKTARWLFGDQKIRLILVNFFVCFGQKVFSDIIANILLVIMFHFNNNQKASDNFFIINNLVVRKLLVQALVSEKFAYHA